MRRDLWPDHDLAEIDSPVAKYQLDQRIAGKSGAVFVAQRGDGSLGGFVEVALRPFADSCHTSPVGYIEGWHVDPDLRRRGVGRALIDMAEQWTREQGAVEIASDCNANNSVSYVAHQRLGYVPTNRLILFRKPLAEQLPPVAEDWIALVSHELWVGTAVKLVSDSRAGGIDIFLGTTRAERSPDGRELLALDYEAYGEMALEQMRRLAKTARQNWPIVRLALLHRVGRVLVGKPSVIIAVATPHRADAFDACRFLIDAVKKDVPIWKKQIWDNGDSAWVEKNDEL